jgi:uncharacterized protein with GYD domain
MPSYLVQVSYTSSALAALVDHPQSRTEAIRKVIEKLGGTVGPFYLSFGEYDTVGIFDVPDNVSAAAFALAIGAGGACKSVRTTPLISTEDGLAALKKAGSSGYKPVGAKK